MGSLVLQLFGCGKEEGILKEVELEPETLEYDSENDFMIDAMPLVPVYNQSDANLENAIQFYEGQHVNFERIGTTERDLGDQSGIKMFDEYLVMQEDGNEVPVYAMTSSYLYYLNDETWDSNLLGGVQPNPGEVILILKPLPKNRWVKWHPGKMPKVVEYAYLNVTPDEDRLKILIEKSVTQSFHKKVYKLKKGVEIGDNENWATEYLSLFKEYPDVPIVICGGESIGKITRSNPADIEQQMQMLIALEGDPPTWIGHDYEVKAFFNYYQRGIGLAGHPLIAKLLNRSVRSGTIDIIRRNGNDGTRWKDNLVLDFRNLALSSNPEYHPLALDPEEEYHRLAVPRPNLDNLPSNVSAKFKVSNPMGLDITIDRSLVPTEISITPLSFNTTEQIVEVSASLNLPAGTDAATLNITTENDTGETITIHSVLMNFFGFQSLSVKFYKLVDNDPNHRTDMDEQKLREVIAQANEILGRQANVYIEPIEEFNPETGVDEILHELTYPGDLGIIIGDQSRRTLYEFFPDETLPANIQKNLNVIYVWSQVGKSFSAELGGITYGDSETGYSIIYANTKDRYEYLLDTSQLGMALVHEIGHWFGIIFIEWPTGIACENEAKHFRHPPFCTEGDWALYHNLMGTSGGLFISFDQAQIYNENAANVLVHPNE